MVSIHAPVPARPRNIDEGQEVELVVIPAKKNLKLHVTDNDSRASLREQSMLHTEPLPEENDDKKQLHKIHGITTHDGVFCNLSARPEVMVLPKNDTPPVSLGLCSVGS